MRDQGWPQPGVGAHTVRSAPMNQPPRTTSRFAESRNHLRP